jgi:carbonic anhydrase
MKYKEDKKKADKMAMNGWLFDIPEEKTQEVNSEEVKEESSEEENSEE